MIKQVRDNIYIGDADSGEDVEELGNHGIDVIVNLSAGCKPQINKHYDVMHLPIPDGESCTAHQFERAAVSAAYEVRENKRVLIHCHAGQSRSPAITAATIALLEDMPYTAALEIVKDAHPGASPLPIFKERAETFLERNSVGDR